MMEHDIAAFVKGLGIGAAVAAPVGPMSVLCMRRTLALGWRFGVGTGAGIAAGDALYALAAALGLASVMRFMVAYERPLHLAAGLFLVYLGWRTFWAPAARARQDAPTRSLLSAFSSALLLTLTNPPTIISFFAIFAVLEPARFDLSTALGMVSGVGAGSLLWWLLMTAFVAAARQALGQRARRWIDRLSGVALGLLGAAEIRRA